MDTAGKLEILSRDSQYDLACACGTHAGDRRRRGTAGRWLYPVPLPQGGYSVLLKTLLSNACVNDCKYCPLRAGTDVERCTLQPEEVARILMEYVRKGKVFGLFLSSGMMREADYTMDRINTTARILRQKYRFRGYIHLKIIPGASNAAIEESLSLASGVSLNIETPGKRHSDVLSGKKDYLNDIMRPLKLMGRLTEKGRKLERVKCTTQFIVGASDETDSEIIGSMFDLYDQMNFRRIYFSSYQKGLGTPDIPGERRSVAADENSFVREHRLYQVDFLIRRYGFSHDDIILNKDGNLCLERDPKQVWADNHPEFFPVRVNSSAREDLLRVPGLGPYTVEKILRTRRARRIDGPQVLGIAGKRIQKVREYLIYE